jgi:hypothetical protein
MRDEEQALRDKLRDLDLQIEAAEAQRTLWQAEVARCRVQKREFLNCCPELIELHTGELTLINPRMVAHRPEIKIIHPIPTDLEKQAS